MNQRKFQIKMGKNSRILIQNIKESLNGRIGFDTLCEEAISEIMEVNSKREYPLSISWSYTPNYLMFFPDVVNSEGKFRYWYSKDDRLSQYFNKVASKMVGDWVISGSRWYTDGYIETISSQLVDENALIGAVLHRLLKSRVLKKDESLVLDDSSREMFLYAKDVVGVILTLWVWEPDESTVNCIEQAFLINFRNGSYNSSSKNYYLCKDEVVRELSDHEIERSQEMDYQFDYPEIG